MQFTTTIATVPALSADMLDIPPAKLARPGYMRTIILAKIAALQSMLGEPVIVWNGPVRAPEKARKAAVRKPAALSGPEFWERASAAYAAVRREYGDAWRYHAPAVWASLPTRLRSFKSARGVAVRYMRDHRFPAAQFWPGGVLPEGPEYRAVEPVRYSGPEAGTLCALNGTEFTFHWPVELSAWLAQQDQIAADKMWPAAQQRAREEIEAEKIAALLYPDGDDGLIDDEDQLELAEAAD